MSEKALRTGALRQLGETLDPGAAVAALLVEHAWLQALDDVSLADRRKPLASELVDVAGLEELTSELIAAAGYREEMG